MLTHGPAQKWPIKIKWAGPAKGPQDFADHTGPAQLKAHKILKALVGRPVNRLPCFGPIADPYLIRSINSLPCSGPNKGPYEIRPVNSLPPSGPYYGPYQIRPFKSLWAKLWPISDSACQLDAVLLGPLEARLEFLFARGPFSNMA
jgi:hypothetical protein